MTLPRVLLTRLHLLIAMVVCIATSAAIAAPKPATITAVEFGYGNAVPVERWAPVRVTITSSGGPFSGRLLLRYRQDSSQSQIISVPASVGPGAAVPVEVIVNFPEDPDLITLTLLDDRDDEVDSVLYGRPSSNQPPGLIPYTPDNGDGLIACVGRISAAQAVTTRWLGRSREFYYYAQKPWNPPTDLEVVRMQRGARLRAVMLDPKAISTSWAAFDSLEAMIVRPEEISNKVNEDSRRAVMKWVEAGGRLVIQVDQVGESWRSWLPPEIAAEIRFGDTVRLDRPPEVEVALRRPVLVDTVSTRKPGPPSIEPIAPGQKGPEAEPAIAKNADIADKLLSAEQIPGRCIEISDSLAAKGWQLAWTSGGKSLIAHGPVGFGHVSIIGCDPSLAASVPNNEATYRLWLDVFRAPLEDWLSFPDVYTTFYRGLYGFSGGNEISGANEHQRQAVVSVLNSVADEPSRVFNPMAVVATVLGCIFLLAIVIGPFDAIVLKRHALRQISWLTAIAWIVGMTILAAFAPLVLRGDLRTLVLRERVIDQIGDGPIWSANALGFFSGSPGSHALRFPSPGAFVRGASAIQSYSRTNEVLPPIRSSHGLAIDGNDRVGYTSPDSLEQGQWTFRTLLDEGPGIAADRLHATAEFSSTGVTVDVARLKPELTGKPFTPQVRTATLRVGSRTVPLLTPPEQSTFSGGHLKLTAISNDLLTTNEPIDWVQSWGVMNTTTIDATGNLPGSQRRRLGFESRLRGGNFALLTLSLADTEADVVADEDDARYHTIRTYRILIPVVRPPAQRPDKGAMP